MTISKHPAAVRVCITSMTVIMTYLCWWRLSRCHVTSHVTSPSCNNQVWQHLEHLEHLGHLGHLGPSWEHSPKPLS